MLVLQLYYVFAAQVSRTTVTNLSELKPVEFYCILTQNHARQLQRALARDLFVVHHSRQRERHSLARGGVCERGDCAEIDFMAEGQRVGAEQSFVGVERCRVTQDLAHV